MCIDNSHEIGNKIYVASFSETESLQRVFKVSLTRKLFLHT